MNPIKLSIDINSLVNDAQNKGLGKDIVTDPTKSTDPQRFVYNIIFAFIWIIGVIAVIVMIFGGLQYITAGGDAEKAERGKKTLIGAIIGLVIAITAYAAWNTTAKLLERGNTDAVLNEAPSENVPK